MFARYAILYAQCSTSSDGAIIEESGAPGAGGMSAPACAPEAARRMERSERNLAEVVLSPQIRPGFDVARLY